MLVKFLNATTLDGYNPYRVTRDGIEWEVPEPDNPWSNIGYWSDHQIIYLQKLLEIAEQVHPGTLSTLWNRRIFAYANVPYRLRPYPEMLADWQNTIEFDWEMEEAITASVASLGTDGRLLRDADGAVIHVTLTEKLLSLLLAKLTNLAPEGGIWMNTQRPEWNDANNALVGKGLSVVTVAYLRRFIAFWQTQLEDAETEAFVGELGSGRSFVQVHAILTCPTNMIWKPVSVIRRAGRSWMSWGWRPRPTGQPCTIRFAACSNRTRLPNPPRLLGAGAKLHRTDAESQSASGWPCP